MSLDRARRGGLAGLVAGAGPGLGGSCAGCLGAGSAAAGSAAAAGWIGVAVGVAAVVVLGARQVRRSGRACPTARSRRRTVFVHLGVLAISAVLGFVVMQELIVLFARALAKMSTH
jgi:hypothetical protein